MSINVRALAALSAMVLVLAGCQSMPATEGAGFKRLNPNAGTRAYILKNDLPFARDVAATNRACDRSAACQKSK